MLCAKIGHVSVTWPIIPDKLAVITLIPSQHIRANQGAPELGEVRRSSYLAVFQCIKEENILVRQVGKLLLLRRRSAEKRAC